MTARAVSMLLAGAIGCAAALLDAAERSAPVAAGEAAPDFTLSDHQGRSHSLSAQRGKRPVVLVFYRGHW